MQKIDFAINLLRENEATLFGIFGVVASSSVFPSRPFLNEFFMLGRDPCDQDGRMSPWVPFALSKDEFELVKANWIQEHPGAKEDALGAADWNDWIQAILNSGADD
jgi:hypothetical protein